MGCVWFAVNETNGYMRWFSIMAAVIVLVMHAANMKRIFTGKENKFKWPKNKKE